MYLCTVKSKYIFALFVAFLLLSACHKDVPVDPLRRSRVDGLNKEAFVNRYRDPQRCLALSDSALAYVRDSLPEYVDGELRARNNMAFAYFLTSDYPNASLMLDQVDKLVALRNPAMRNGDIELVIANLLRARLLQRNCQIAGSTTSAAAASSRTTANTASTTTPRPSTTSPSSPSISTTATARRRTS